ncbi:MAG: hypothetical protein ACKVJC_08525, partial [Flavobacteriales bacterium]
TLDIDTLSTEEQTLLLSFDTMDKELEVANEVVELEEGNVIPVDFEETEQKEVPLGEPEVKLEDENTLKASLYQKSNEANTWKQKFEALEKKQTEIPIEKKQFDKSNMWDDEIAAERWQAMDEMKSEVGYLKAERAKLQAERENDKLFKDVTSFQETNTALDTIKPIREINDLYVSSIQANNTEPSADEMKSLGVAAKDFENYKHLLDVVNHKAQYGSKTMEGAYYDSGKASVFNTTDPTEGVRKKANQDSYKRADERPAVMGNGGYSGGATEWDNGTINKWLSEHPDPSKYNDKDRETAQAIYAKLGL